MNRLVLVVCLSVCGVGVVGAQTSPSSGSTPFVYDSFSRLFIDPIRWVGMGGWSSETLELVREVKDGHLRLAARTYGNRWSDEGYEYDLSELDFRDPGSITSFGARVVVTRAGSLRCAANDWGPDPSFMLGGNFFHVGDSTSNQGNVDASLSVAYNGPNTPLTVRLSVGIVGGSEGDYWGADLGTLRIGQEAFLLLRWDKANKRFIGGMKKVGYRLVTAAIPYYLDDSTPPPGLYKGISIRNSAPNCASTPAFAYMEALVDDVVVNVPWEP